MSYQDLKTELEALLAIPKGERDAGVQQRIATLLSILSEADQDEEQNNFEYETNNNITARALNNDTQNQAVELEIQQEFRKFDADISSFIETGETQDSDTFDSELQDQLQDDLPPNAYINGEHERPVFIAPELTPDTNIDTGGSGGDSSPPPAVVTFNADFANHYIIGRFDGSSNIDNLTLSRGKDTIYASSGDDIIDGNDGVDTYRYSGSSDLTANLLTGNATSATSGTDTLTNIENITGSSGDDHITGDGNNNILRGGSGNDILIGGAGNDWLYGDNDVDTLTGGSGADRFIWTYWDDVSDVDTITDFNAADGDVIDMTDLFYEYWNLIEYNFFAHDISEFFRFVDSGSDTTLQLDLDGNGSSSSFEDLLIIEGGAGLDAQTLESTGNLMIMPASRHNDVVYDPTYDVSTAKFAIDGGKIIGGSWGQINIYDIDTRNESILIENSDFTRDVEAENGLVVVGAYRANSNAGSAYVYDLDGNLVYTLNNPDPSANDYFGTSVDISSNYIIVGADYNDPNDTNDGSVYIYSTADGSLLHTIDSPEAAITSSLYFGRDVAITDNYAVATVGYNSPVAGKSGTIYVYDPATAGLLYSIENPNDGDAGSYIGYNVAVSDQYLLVSDHLAEIDGQYQAGQVLLYDITDGSLLYTFSDPTPENSDQFGQSVDLVGDYSVIAQTAAGPGDDYLPAVYVYSNLDGELEAIIRQPYWSELDYSSNRMAASDTMIVIDSSYADYYSEEAFIYQVDFLGNDLMTGTDQRDTLVGLDGDDTIYGGAENDQIYGGRGDDQLYGGSGDDWFFYDEASLDGSVDVIHDISVLDGDVIDLRFIDFSYNMNATGIADYLRVEVSGSDLVLSYNTNGSGLDADYTDLAVLKDTAQYTLYDLLLYRTLNVEAPAILIGGIVNPSTQDNTRFAQSVDVANGYIYIGDGTFDDGDGANNGRIYVYDADTQALVHTYDDTTSSSGNYTNTFVSSSDAYIAIGNSYPSTGLVSVYNSSDHTLAYTVSHPEGISGDAFGAHILISDTHLMASSYKDVDGNSNSGAVHIFDNTDGSLLYTIDNPTAEANAYFGDQNSLALTSNYAIIGDRFADTAYNNGGAVYVYNLTDGSLAYSLTSPLGSGGSQFGTSVRATENHLVASHRNSLDVGVYDIDDGSLLYTIDGNTSLYGIGGQYMDINDNYIFIQYAKGYYTNGHTVIYDINDGSIVDAISFNLNSGDIGFINTYDPISVDNNYLVTLYTFQGETYALTYDTDSTNSDFYNGSADNDYFIGLSGDDVINGNAGHDMLYGSIGEDVIHGGAGNDHIYGGADSDELYGDGGADTFYLNDADSADTIHDFNTAQGDAIDITELLSAYDSLDDAILDFVRISDNGADSVLYVDVNGATGGEEFVAAATIVGGAGLDVLSLVSNGNLVLDSITAEARSTYTW